MEIVLGNGLQWYYHLMFLDLRFSSFKIHFHWTQFIIVLNFLFLSFSLVRTEVLNCTSVNLCSLLVISCAQNFCHHTLVQLYCSTYQVSWRDWHVCQQGDRSGPLPPPILFGKCRILGRKEIYLKLRLCNKPILLPWIQLVIHKNVLKLPNWKFVSKFCGCPSTPPPVEKKFHSGHAGEEN